MRTYLTGRNLIIDTKIHLNFILYLTRYTILSTNFSACIHKNMNFHKYTQSLIIDINRPKCPYTLMNISIDCSVNFIYFIRETPLQRTTSITFNFNKILYLFFLSFFLIIWLERPIHVTHSVSNFLQSTTIYLISIDLQNFVTWIAYDHQVVVDDLTE